MAEPPQGEKRIASYVLGDLSSPDTTQRESEDRSGVLILSNFPVMNTRQPESMDEGQC